MSLIIRSNVKELHNAGYKGKGRHGVIYDTRISKTFPIHPETVLDVGLQVAPEAIGKIIIFSDFISNLEEIIAYAKLHAKGQLMPVNMSMTGINVDLHKEFYEAWGHPDSAKILDEFFNTCYIIASSGNTGKEEYRFPASTEYYRDICLAVGACYPLGSSIRMKSYSTWNDRVDIANFSGITLSKTVSYGGVTAEKGKVLDGTSYSAPYTWGEVILFQEMFLELVGREATVKEINNYFFSHCEQIEGEKDGHGCPVMEVLKMKTLRLEFPFGKDYYIVDGIRVKVDCDEGTTYATTSIGGNTVTPMNIQTLLFGAGGALNKKTIMDARKDWDAIGRVAYFEFDYVG